MGLQLFIYPQNNPDGIFDYTTTTSNFNYVTDPKFTDAGKNGMLIHATGGMCPSSECMYHNIPKVVWQAWHSDGTTVAAPQVSGTPLQDVDPPSFQVYNGGSNWRMIMTNNPGGDYSHGIYQIVQGLTVGVDYDLDVEFNNTGCGQDQWITGSFCTGFTQSVFTDSAGTQHETIPGGGFGLFIEYGVDITGTLTNQFTATAQDMLLVLEFRGSGCGILEINKVSILESGGQTGTGNTTTIGTSGQEMLDLMDDSSIPVTLSVDNFKNVGEKTQSYSKAFNLPSTKHNNRIFNNLYDVTIASGTAKGNHFNMHRQTKAILKDNGFAIFEGWLKLISIKEKDGVPSYNVNLFSDSISLKQALSKKTFADFDGGTLGGGVGFNELGHEYNKTNIKLSWTGATPITALPAGYSGFAGVAGATSTNVIKYPFCRWNTNISVSNGTGTFPLAGSPVLSDLTDAFRPWIKLKYLLDRIISEAGFSYSSTFLNSSDFTRLFMDFNWGKEQIMAPSSETVVGHQMGDPSVTLVVSSPTVEADWKNLELNSGGINIMNPQSTPTTALVAIGYNTSTYKFTAPQTTTTYTFQSEWIFDITAVAGASNAAWDTRVVHKDSSGGIISQQTFNHVGSVGVQQSWLWSGTFVLNQNETIEFQGRLGSNGVAQSAPWNGGVKQEGMLAGSVGQWNYMQVVCDIDPQLSTGSLLQKRGKIKQWDFVKDIFTMFNLVAMQDRQNPNNLIIEPYKDVFIDDSASSFITINILDWTDKVDIDSMQITPMKLKEKVKFDYKKPKDYANKMYTDETGLQFGSFEIDATGFDLASGEQKIALKVFSPTFLAPVFDDWNVIMTVPHITGGEVATGADGGVENNPRILYDATYTSSPQIPAGTGITLNPDEYRIPAQAGLFGENQMRFGLFSHLSRHPSNASTLDYNFGAHQIVGYGGVPPVHNLFNRYWAPYFDELYHPDTKVVKLQINLESEDISKFNFNDKIRIKNRLYRANKIDYKPKALSSVELILLP